MNIRHLNSALVALFFLMIFPVSGHSDIPPTPKEKRIACIGNSITAGARIDHPEKNSYPAILLAMLQAKGYSHYVVRNFGIGGATVLKFGTPNIWSVLDSLAKYIPDVVIIEVGTNETVGAPRRNWENIASFEKDYAEYIRNIKKINPACRIVLCSPLDMVLSTSGLSVERTENLTERRPRVWELRDRIKRISEDKEVYFLDLTKYFEGKSELMTPADGVHPNQMGYAYLSEQVFTFMKKNKIIKKRP